MFVDFICTVPFLADKGCPQNEYEQNEYVCCWLCYKFFCVFSFHYFCSKRYFMYFCIIIASKSIFGNALLLPNGIPTRWR